MSNSETIHRCERCGWEGTGAEGCGTHACNPRPVRPHRSGGGSEFMGLAAAVLASRAYSRYEKARHGPNPGRREVFPKESPTRKAVEHTAASEKARFWRQVRRGMLDCPKCGTRCRATCGMTEAESYEYDLCDEHAWAGIGDCPECFPPSPLKGPVT